MYVAALEYLSAHRRSLPTICKDDVSFILLIAFQISSPSRVVSLSADLISFMSCWSWALLLFASLKIYHQTDIVRVEIYIQVTYVNWANKHNSLNKSQ